MCFEKYFNTLPNKLSVTICKFSEEETINCQLKQPAIVLKKGN